MSRLDDIRERVAQGRVAVGLGTTCNALAQLLDDVEWLMGELEPKPTARYEFKVGPANRHSEYADLVTVYAATFSEAVAKAKRFRGHESNPRDASVWLQRIEEHP